MYFFFSSIFSFERTIKTSTDIILKIAMANFFLHFYIPLPNVPMKKSLEACLTCLIVLLLCIIITFCFPLLWIDDSTPFKCCNHFEAIPLNYHVFVQFYGIDVPTTLLCLLFQVFAFRKLYRQKKLMNQCIGQTHLLAQ